MAATAVVTMGRENADTKVTATTIRGNAGDTRPSRQAGSMCVLPQAFSKGLIQGFVTNSSLPFLRLILVSSMRVRWIQPGFLQQKQKNQRYFFLTMDYLLQPRPHDSRKWVSSKNAAPSTFYIYMACFWLWPPSTPVDPPTGDPVSHYTTLCFYILPARQYGYVDKVKAYFSPFFLSPYLSPSQARLGSTLFMTPTAGAQKHTPTHSIHTPVLSTFKPNQVKSSLEQTQQKGIKNTHRPTEVKEALFVFPHKQHYVLLLLSYILFFSFPIFSLPLF